LAVRKLGLCVGSACFPGRASGRARAGRARRFLGTDGGAGSRRHAACARRGFGFRFHEPLLRAGNWISGLPSTTPRVPSHLHDFVASLSLPLVAGPYPPSAPPYYRLSCPRRPRRHSRRRCRRCRRHRRFSLFSLFSLTLFFLILSSSFYYHRYRRRSVNGILLVRS
jgi:hypothetical protein